MAWRDTGDKLGINVMVSSDRESKPRGMKKMKVAGHISDIGT